MPKEPKIKASSTVIDITGLPPGVTWTQEGNTITFSEPIFMEKNVHEEKTIKQLLKEVGEKQAKFPCGAMDYVSGFGSFQELVKRIKSLRKENKRLKKERKNAMGAYILLQDMILKEKTSTLPVAEFKCAKTNKPEKDEIAQYWCIYKGWVNGRIYMGYLNYHGHEIGWGKPNNEILAFTETDPSQIVGALNKEK